MPCDDNSTGIPMPSSSIVWTGGVLNNVPKPSTMCSVKLEYVISTMDTVLKAQLDSFDMSKVNGQPFVADASMMNFYDFVNAISVWANTTKAQIEALQKANTNLESNPITINMSCLVGENCSVSEYPLLNVLETIVSRLCQQSADIERIKQVLQTNFNTAQIYIPQT